MEPAQRNLLLLIAVGGSAVLASYYPAFFGDDDTLVEALWGGIPESLRGFYGVNMLLAAASFFPATIALGFATPLESFRSKTGSPFGLLLAAYAAILLPSALWLPLTDFYLGAPSSLTWWIVRLDLLIVGAGASLLGWMLIRRARSGPLWVRGAALGFFFFWLQTMLLDALVWPWFFER